MEPFSFVFIIAVLVVSVIIHEISHGFMAEFLGDPTARLAGRLTLNPIPHIDFFGSIILPALLISLKTGFVIGWAKPVPYNPYNLRGRYGSALVAFAGPFANIAIAFIFGLLIRFSETLGLSDAMILITSYVVIMNIMLAFLNLLPIPPLDGSKIVFDFLPYHLRPMRDFLERYSIFLLIFLIFFLWEFLLPIPLFFFQVFTGIAF